MIQNQTLPETETAVRTLKEGGVILYPTDTIWGLGCDALDESATERIYSIKERPRHKPLILLMDSIAMLKRFIPDIHPRLETLLAYHQRPLTVVHSTPNNLPAFACGADGSVAVRITMDPFCKGLIRQLDRPLVSTSANRSSAPAPASFGHICSSLISAVDYVVQYKQEVVTTAAPSPIVKLSDKAELIFLRE
ncbi:MAG: threonylcarbamoyl-AMP synthase [Saprospiraceae bacterium]|nr:threonylcarbamoyl-AMP synthase [Saprospiraceae bacterium]